VADALKSFFSKDLVAKIAASIKNVHPAFPSPAFQKQASRDLEGLELLDRGRQIATALHGSLPPRFPEAADILIRSLGSPLPAVEGNGMAPFFYLPHVVFAAEYGLDDFDVAMRLQRELTRRFSAEFSIRAFLDRDPARTLAVLKTWARDPDVHVRRLVSEGTRPRLPWAPRLRAFQRDPGPVLELLELLKDDPERYVQRSVANNLNDIGKDHPHVLVDVARRWLPGAPQSRAWIVRHALRWLVKQGNAAALEVLGCDDAADIEVTARIAPRRVRIGGQVLVRLEVHNAGAAPVQAVVDLAVHFVKTNGAARPKVFKGAGVRLAPGERVAIPCRVSFALHTTRTAHPGRHLLEARVNGRVVPLGHVQVVG
jgi:3-methyladenine DNA glycosylase AlkC